MDASVLINLLHIGRLPLLARLPDLQPLIPEEVIEEVRLPDQQAELRTAIEAGYLTRVAVDDPAVLETFADLRDSLGRGEAACLALAQHRVEIAVACDEKGAFLRTATERLGEGRVLTTADLLLMCIRAELLSVAEADAAKELLSTRKFRMPFGSFKELIDAQSSRGPDDGR
jgi:predicted nucleic acid-binding protein